MLDVGIFLFSLFLLREALERVGLSAALNRFGGDPLGVQIGVLSMGERQRVGVARLLCQAASLILLDEPDANLDRDGVALMAKLIHELAQDSMIALVAHSADLLDVADRLLVMDGGCLVRDETNMRLRLPSLAGVSRGR